MRRSELKETARSRNIVGILRSDREGVGDMGDRDEILRNVVFDILARTTKN